MTMLPGTLEGSSDFLRVLYIHSAGAFGGSSRSLFEVLRALPAGQVEMHFVVQKGTSTEVFRKVSEEVIAVRGLTRFDNTGLGRYRRIRWLILLREVYHLPFTIFALYKAKQRWHNIDIIHQNEIVDVVAGLIARWLFKVPLVVHVRSVQNADPTSLRTRTMNAILQKKTAAVICIDETVRASLPNELGAIVIHNAFDESDAASQLSNAIKLQLQSLRSESLKVCFVGNLFLEKGVLDLVEAARIAKEKGADIDYVIVGGETRKSGAGLATILGILGLKNNVGEEMRSRISAYGLDKCFHFTGATPAIQKVFEKIDVLTFPSHLDAPGRPIFEAAFFGVPSVVAINSPKPDTMIDGETGIAVPARNPERLAAAFMRLAHDRRELRRMGENARSLARRNFMPSTNAKLLLDVYRRVAAQAGVKQGTRCLADEH